MISLYQIAEKCKYVLGGGNLQALTSFVQDAYATVAKQSFYENKANDSSEVDGIFITTFKNIEPLLDLDIDEYFIVVPSSHLRLPHEMGINMVCFMKGNKSPFVRVGAASTGIWANVKANVLGGNQTYYEEGIRMYFPKMDNTTNKEIMLKMTVALDIEDVTAQLNIPPDVVDIIVGMVVQKLSAKEPIKPEYLT